MEDDNHAIPRTNSASVSAHSMAADSALDQKSLHSTSNYKLHYDQTKYMAQKQAVMEARRATFGIFKKSSSKV